MRLKAVSEITSKVAKLGEISCVKNLLALFIHHGLGQGSWDMPRESVPRGDGEVWLPPGNQRWGTAPAKGPPQVGAITPSLLPQDSRFFWSREGYGLRAGPRSWACSELDPERKRKNQREREAREYIWVHSQRPGRYWRAPLMSPLPQAQPALTKFTDRCLSKLVCDEYSSFPLLSLQWPVPSLSSQKVNLKSLLLQCRSTVCFLGTLGKKKSFLWSSLQNLMSLKTTQTYPLQPSVFPFEVPQTELALGLDRELLFIFPRVHFPLPSLCPRLFLQEGAYSHCSGCSLEISDHQAKRRLTCTATALLSTSGKASLVTTAAKEEDVCNAT